MNRDDWKGLRDKWTKARDKAGVSSGAVKGVKMGDAIELVYKAWKKGLGPLGIATTGLLADVKKYKAGVSAKQKGAAEWLAKHVEAPADEILEALKSDADHLTQIVRRFEEIRISKGLAFPDASDFRTANDQVANSNGAIDWKTASAPLYARLKKSLQVWNELGTDVKKRARAIKIEYPGKLPAATVVDLADGILHEVRVVIDLLTTQNRDWEAFAMQAKGCRDSQQIIRIKAIQMQKDINSMIDG